MAIAVRCEDCTHEEECYSKMKELGIITYVKGLVDCDGFKKREQEATDEH